MRLKSIITLSGHISAGKSYAANVINEELRFPIASFGGYLKYYCEQNKLESDRKTFQDVGEALVKANPKQFLIDVISHYIGSADNIILEGVRHKSILEEARKLTDNFFSVFIDTEVNTRYMRYYNRHRDSDELETYEQFVTSDNHPVELEIETLKSLCDSVINNSSTPFKTGELIESIKSFQNKLH